ncbi:MAG TPA: FAD-binding oxidoreductase, partial [Longimicrobiales bacterium]
GAAVSAHADLSHLPGVGVEPGESTNFRVHGVVPAIVAAPESAKAAAAVLALASERGWQVEIAGRGGCLESGRPPRGGQVDVLLTTARLDALAEYAPADLTVTAGAGMTLGRLEATLAQSGQFLPLDPAGAAGATLGAVVARGDAGPLRLGYGTPRDHVLGLELVTGDGRVLQLGGRVMKNVAGYDLTRLVVGSRGTLGLITRVTARLRPLPRADRTLALRSSVAQACVSAARAIRQERLEPVAMEILSPEASARVAAAGAWTLLLRLHGPAGAVDELAPRVERIAAGEGRAVETLEPEAAAVAWSTLSTLEAQAALVIRLAALPGELGRTLSLAQEVADAGGWSDGARVAHAGDGIVRVLGPAAADAPAWGDVAAAVERARLTLSPAGGTVVIARAPAELMQRIDPFGYVGAATLMEGIRRTFDPAGVLSPGRFAI